VACLQFYSQCEVYRLQHFSTQRCTLQGPDAAERFLQECRGLGFDALEFGCAPFRDEACGRMVADITQVPVAVQPPGSWHPLMLDNQQT
jgi:hypothetical protein